METKKSNFLNNRQKEVIEEINEQIDTLNSSITKEVESQDFNLDNYKRLSKKIDALKEEKRVFNIGKKLERLNKKYQDKREILKEFLTICLPIEDITNVDGSIHKTKINKHPILKAFFEKHDIKNVHFSHKADKYTGFYSRNLGTDFDIIESGKYAEKEHNYLTFEELLKRNSIRAKNLSLRQFLSLESKLLKEREKIENLTNKYRKTLDSLQFSKLESEKLITTSYNVQLQIPSKIYH